MCEFAQQILSATLSNIDVGLAITHLEDLKMITLLMLCIYRLGTWIARLEYASQVRRSSIVRTLSVKVQRRLPKVDNIALAHDMNWYYGIEAPRSTTTTPLIKMNCLRRTTPYINEAKSYHILGQC